MLVNIQKSEIVLQKHQNQQHSIAKSSETKQTQKTSKNPMGIDGWELTKASLAGSAASIFGMGATGFAGLLNPTIDSFIDKAVGPAQLGSFADSKVAYAMIYVSPAIAGALASQLLTDNVQDGAMVGGVVGMGVASLAMGVIMKNVSAAGLGAIVGIAGGAVGGAIAQQ